MYVGDELTSENNETKTNWNSVLSFIYAKYFKY